MELQALQQTGGWATRHKPNHTAGSALTLPRSSSLHSDTERGQQLGPHADRRGWLSPGASSRAASPIPLSPGVWGIRL